MNVILFILIMHHKQCVANRTIAKYWDSLYN